MVEIQHDYDKSDAESIYQFARQIKGKSLAQVVPGVIDENARNRGDLGSLIEKHFFKHEAGSFHGPDFAEAGLELKVTGVLKDSKGGYKAKERLVISMINFDHIVEEDFESSVLLEKCSHMLLLFYFYQEGVGVVDFRFVLDPMLFSLSPEDEVVIKRDWETIKQKVLDGKAHELSEGDTYYLGACRKGSGGINEKLRKQPFSAELAKSRAFSFKQSYLTQIIKGHDSADETLPQVAELGIEEATRLKLQPYLGKSIDELSEIFSHFKKGSNHKGFHREIANRMLGDGKRRIVELEKAGIELKTIRRKSNGSPREAMSFPAFDYLSIVDEDWDSSVFSDRLEHRFLFIVFRVDSAGVERFEKAAYWTMPFEDREEARRVWEETKRRVAVDASNLPKSTESRVAHVRPKAQNGDDKILTPQGDLQVKKAFWLNQKYISAVIENL